MAERIISLPGGRRILYDRLSGEQQQRVDAMLAEFQALKKRNPLEGFEPHSDAQREFLWARTPIVAAQCGNRFGKTTVLLVRGAVECLPEEWVPGHLGGIKQFDGPTYGWILCPTEDKISDTYLPAIRKWWPQAALKGGSVDKAFNGERNTVTFQDGSHVAFKTYKQAPDTLESAAIHWVAYDEPPPREHREACMTRLLDYGGYEMFTYTPLKANTGYVKREIYKKRASPDITLVRGSMHDNPTLDVKTKDRVLGTFTDLWRQAREFGDFVDVGGLIYEGFEQAVVPQPWPREFVQTLDVVVGIDPGIRNAGFAWVGYDHENVAYVFDEALIQDGTVADYAQKVQAVNAKWGLTGRREPMYVTDPAARQRGQVNATTVKAELANHGIYAGDGQNDVEAGCQQIRGRLQGKRFYVSPTCLGLRDEADEYAAEEREDGKFVPVKGYDHRLDALRYACMTHPWLAELEAEAPHRSLGYRPNFAPPSDELLLPAGSPPMGSMS